MSLLTVAQARALVKTGLTDAQLQVIIDWEEAEIARRYGAHYVDALTAFAETVPGGEGAIYLRRPILSVSSITETYAYGSTPTTVTSSYYLVWANEGRIERSGGSWAPSVTVSYVPQDDSARRRQILIELVRLAVEQTAMKSESVAGEYSFQAPDWELARAKLYRRMGYRGV